MSEPIDNDTGARMRAITAAELIADYARAGLPLVCWRVFDFEGTTELGAMAEPDVVHAFAVHLGVTPFDPHPRSALRYAEVRAEVRGVIVRVSAELDGTKTPKHTGSAR